MTGIGFGWDEENWKKWWPADLHIIGKDINRFHTVYWPAMLLSAGIPLPKEILIHGFVNAKGGEKFSKSLGNAPEPKEVIEKYGLEPIRYFLLSQTPINGDSDFDPTRFEEVFNADLANGLGNLVARVAKLCEKINFTAPGDPSTRTLRTGNTRFDPEVEELLKEYKFNEALSWIWKTIAIADGRVNQTKPWTLEGNDLKEVLDELVELIQRIGFNLQPFLPETSEKILKQFSGSIKSSTPLFPRI